MHTCLLLTEEAFCSLPLSLLPFFTSCALCLVALYHVSVFLAWDFALQNINMAATCIRSCQWSFPRISWSVHLWQYLPPHLCLPHYCLKRKKLLPVNSHRQTDSCVRFIPLPHVSSLFSLISSCLPFPVPVISLLPAYFPAAFFSVAMPPIMYSNYMWREAWIQGIRMS